MTGKKITPENDPMLQMVLARLRQLAAHETGHTLGLAHNFAASSYPHTPEQSVSVMDYPHPWITLDKSGIPDVSQAYGVNIGQWDKVAIDYGYREFAPGSDEAAQLNQILTDSAKTGLIYITDEDARPSGGAQPHAHLWDNGTDAADELNRIFTIRAAALARFGENAIKPGAPMAQLEDTLVPLYLLHRYQTEATIKEIGGLDYQYQLRGSGQPGPVMVSAAEQKKALAAVVKTLSPEFLTLPEAAAGVVASASAGVAADSGVVRIADRADLRSSGGGGVGGRFDAGGAVQSTTREPAGGIPCAECGGAFARSGDGYGACCGASGGFDGRLDRRGGERGVCEGRRESAQPGRKCADVSRGAGCGSSKAGSHQGGEGQSGGCLCFGADYAAGE